MLQEILEECVEHDVLVKSTHSEDSDESEEELYKIIKMTKITHPLVIM
jgi:hypothetical protein